MNTKKSAAWLLIASLSISMFSGCQKPAAVSEPTKQPAEIPTPNLTVSQGTTIEVPFTPKEFKTQVPAYTLKPDLSNIANLSQFPKLSSTQKALLVKNGFFVCPSKEEQLFYIYEDNEYKKIPAFVTADTVLQIYHVFYDYSLRTLEEEKLLSILEELNLSMMEKSSEALKGISNETIKIALIKNTAYFATAQLALDKPLPDSLPAEAVQMAKEEYKRIEAASGIQKSAISPYDIDYTQYEPRGHYTRTDAMKKYFKAMMWYGQSPFPLYKPTPEKERDVDSTLRALLITQAIYQEKNGSNDVSKWENIYSPTAFYVGVADDLKIYEYKTLLDKIYGQSPDLNKLDDPATLDKLYALADKLPEPGIQGKYLKADKPVGKQFRFMGQRFIPDSDILQSLVDPKYRPLPKGLDVFAALGNKRAEDILLNHYKENDTWTNYTTELEKTKAKYNALDDKTWRSNLYYSWMWTLKGYLGEFGQGYPSFMTNTAWQDKSLSTALGSWSELKHDTVLYGKQSGAECGGGEEPPKLKGYVEPNIAVYERLLWLNQFSKENLKQRGIITETMAAKLDGFDELLNFLLTCSEKELRNEELTEEEYGQLLTYGGWLEHLTASMAGEPGTKWYEITSETDKNMAIISDIHNVGAGNYLEVGVGPASEIYVATPIGDKIYLTRGAVFSYYEFLTKGKRLTDEDWQKTIKENKQSPMQDWMNSFIDGKTFEIPVPSQPYSSGC